MNWVHFVVGLLLKNSSGYLPASNQPKSQDLPQREIRVGEIQPTGAIKEAAELVMHGNQRFAFLNESWKLPVKLQDGIVKKDADYVHLDTFEDLKENLLIFFQYALDVPTNDAVELANTFEYLAEEIRQSFGSPGLFFRVRTQKQGKTSSSSDWHFDSDGIFSEDITSDLKP